MGVHCQRLSYWRLNEMNEEESLISKAHMGHEFERKDDMAVQLTFLFIRFQLETSVLQITVHVLLSVHQWPWFPKDSDTWQKFFYSVIQLKYFTEGRHVQFNKTSNWHCSYKYKYNERFVRRRSTNRPGAPYNNNNKSVRTIKQNSFKSFLEYVSVSNVM